MSRNLKGSRGRPRTSKGFTLAELLVALFVLSLMLALVGALLRSFILQTGSTRYTYAERSVKFYWLNSVISSAFYYIIRIPNRDPAETREFIEFFDGRPGSMVFITSSPVAFKGVALERLYLEDGAVYLNETPVFSPRNDYLNPQETEETNRMRIVEEVQNIRFTYLKRPGQAAGVPRLGAIGMPVGDAKDLSTKIVETDRLDGEIPVGVRLSVIFNDDRRMDYCFKVQSDFTVKKGMTLGIYHQF